MSSNQRQTNNSGELPSRVTSPILVFALVGVMAGACAESLDDAIAVVEQPLANAVEEDPLLPGAVRANESWFAAPTPLSRPFDDSEVVEVAAAAQPEVEVTNRCTTDLVADVAPSDPVEMPDLSIRYTEEESWPSADEWRAPDPVADELAREVAEIVARSLRSADSEEARAATKLQELARAEYDWFAVNAPEAVGLVSPAGSREP